MKFNWGHGLLIAIIVCTGGILLMVYLSSKQKIDLVADDYYPKGLVYEEIISKMKNTNTLPTRVRVFNDEDSIHIRFPGICEHADSIQGEIWFYFPADKDYDWKTGISLRNNFTQSFDMSRFRKGKYTLFIDWSAQEAEYFQREVVFLGK